MRPVTPGQGASQQNAQVRKIVSHGAPAISWSDIAGKITDDLAAVIPHHQSVFRLTFQIDRQPESGEERTITENFVQFPAQSGGDTDRFHRRSVFPTVGSDITDISGQSYIHRLREGRFLQSARFFPAHRSRCDSGFAEGGVTFPQTVENSVPGLLFRRLSRRHAHGMTQLRIPNQFA